MKDANLSQKHLYPQVDEINQDEDFLAQVITKEEFEKTYQLHEYFENLGFSKR